MLVSSLELTKIPLLPDLCLSLMQTWASQVWAKDYVAKFMLHILFIYSLPVSLWCPAGDLGCVVGSVAKGVPSLLCWAW